MQITSEQILQLIEDQIEHYATTGNRNAIDVLSQLKEDIYGEEQAWLELDMDYGDDLDSTNTLFDMEAPER